MLVILACDPYPGLLVSQTAALPEHMREEVAQEMRIKDWRYGEHRENHKAWYRRCLTNAIADSWRHRYGLTGGRHSPEVQGVDDLDAVVERSSQFDPTAEAAIAHVIIESLPARLVELGPESALGPRPGKKRRPGRERIELHRLRVKFKEECSGL